MKLARVPLMSSALFVQRLILFRLFTVDGAVGLVKPNSVAIKLSKNIKKVPLEKISATFFQDPC
jgi:hypothetical protein